MKELVRNTRYTCHCGRFVRTASVTKTEYVCTACGPQLGTAREVVVGQGAAVVDVLVSIPSRGRVPLTDGQAEFDWGADPDRVCGPPCRPLPCPGCGRFSSQSWDTGPMDTPSGFYQEWGGVCSTHGRWSNSA